MAFTYPPSSFPAHLPHPLALPTCLAHLPFPAHKACKVLDCGFDSGDCGTDEYGELFRIVLDRTPKNYTVPLGVTAVYFNLSDVFGNDTVTMATHTKSSVVRTAVLSQKHRVLTLTLSRNASRESVEFVLQASNVTGSKSEVCVRW